MPLLLGEILFADFEIPSRLAGAVGGRQMLAKHKLIGGKRVTDAMGSDPADPSWEGRFRGPNAEDRARALDQLRSAGQEVLLTFGSFQYMVVVEEFTCEYLQAYEIPYRIKCYITQVDTIDPQPSLDDSISSDLTSLSGQVTQFDSNAQNLADGIQAL